MNGLLITSVTFLTTFYWRGSKLLLKTDCVSHDAYAICQAIRQSELVACDSSKLNKEARISVSVYCKKEICRD